MQTIFFFSDGSDACSSWDKKNLSILCSCTLFAFLLSHLMDLHLEEDHRTVQKDQQNLF